MWIVQSVTAQCAQYGQVLTVDRLKETATLLKLLYTFWHKKSTDNCSWNDTHTVAIIVSQPQVKTCPVVKDSPSLPGEIIPRRVFIRLKKTRLHSVFSITVSLTGSLSSTFCRGARKSVQLLSQLLSCKGIEINIAPQSCKAYGFERGFMMSTAHSKVIITEG